MNKQFAVLGLGSFGGHLVEEFHEIGAEVFAMDRNAELVDKYFDIATHVIQGDAQDEQLLIQAGIRNFDLVVVSFGENIEASILTTIILTDLGVKEIWVKASSLYHQKVLEKIGATRVIRPEKDMARRIAHRLASKHFIDYVELSEEHSMVEIKATPKIIGKTIAALNVRNRFGCNIVGIYRRHDMLVSPSGDDRIEKDDVLIVIGENRKLHRFEKQGV
ncbi:potassium channel family protein [Jeotgalibacillus haloalkalitolerans]|uniref:TrkA family potassium uptake protein n=1 Tax=Jeotgalibacillus haloalkalitolerans TaxID=3104292 RepID=A0ABU5KQB5_9BACL|nr:TrkA family potassium uptake protein [Jeotgalibacillus sp. HH7-29]MDZ5713434.1 TrkA family potassium uptake protein [Jeotgalibacillus sp. HH7-29]